MRGFPCRRRIPEAAESTGSTDPNARRRDSIAEVASPFGTRSWAAASSRYTLVKIRLTAIGTRMPTWVDEGYRDYARRLRGGWSLDLVEVPAARRGTRAPMARIVQEEGDRLLAALPSRANVVALDEKGVALSSTGLARRLAGWQTDGLPLALMIGGPDGLSAHCRERASLCWSLSRLTLPHALVRVVVAEQIYRAWSILQHHPYHRE